MDRATLRHIIEGDCTRYIFRTAYGDAFERPRSVEIRDDYPMEPDSMATIRFDLGEDGLCIRPLDSIISVEEAPRPGA